MKNKNQPTGKPELIIVREFDGPRDLVFRAFANAESMAEWWGPVEFPTTVFRFDFRTKGIFHYKMEAFGKVIWARFVYGKIQEPGLLEFISNFSDENAGIARAPEPFSPTWPLEIFNQLKFNEINGRTTITMRAYPVNASDEENETFRAAQTNVQQGYTGTFNNLENYLKAQSELRKKLKTTNMSRTSTYLNFPGNTEEAFNFYKLVFRSEFHGNGIQRFGELPPEEGQPPLSEADKKLVLHVELPIVGGHILMATDAPESMGFKVIQGNNMYINLEPDSRTESKRIFDALAEDGSITMPLQDMFWGAYFGSCTDKYGINWMVNCSAKN